MGIGHRDKARSRGVTSHHNKELMGTESFLTVLRVLVAIYWMVETGVDGTSYHQTLALEVKSYCWSKGTKKVNLI